MLNLLDNAIKYSEKNSEVAVVLRANDDPSQFCISVENCGLGIPKADLERIFERGYRCRAARQVAVTGTGIGLHVCRVLIESLGGTIHASSQLDAQKSMLHKVAIRISLPLECPGDH